MQQLLREDLRQVFFVMEPQKRNPVTKSQPHRGRNSDQTVRSGRISDRPEYARYNKGSERTESGRSAGTRQGAMTTRCFRLVAPICTA